MMFTQTTARRFSLAAAIGCFAVTPLLAQPVAPQPEIADASPICMTRAEGSDTTVAGSSGVRAIVAVRQSVPELEARGFNVTDCKPVGFEVSADFAKYRDEICNLAAYGNEAVQAQIAEAVGEYPSVLCGNAEKVAGSWDHRPASATE